MSDLFFSILFNLVLVVILVFAIYIGIGRATMIAQIMFYGVWGLLAILGLITTAYHLYKTFT